MGVLRQKYKTEDARSKKFVVDSKIVINQVQELQVILHKIHAEGMTLSETFQVAAIIEKLPPVWNDFKNYLKHKRKEMKIEDLIVRLQIEEDNKGADRKLGNFGAKANVVEYGQRLNMKKKYSGKGYKMGPKGGISKKPKF